MSTGHREVSQFLKHQSKEITVSGEGSASNKHFETVVYKDDYYEYKKPGDIMKTQFRFKVPHGTAMMASLEVYPASDAVKMCALKVTKLMR